MNQAPSMLKPALISGVAFGVAGSIPVVNWINCACCALIIGCGFFAAFLYSKDSRTAGRGCAWRSCCSRSGRPEKTVRPEQDCQV